MDILHIENALIKCVFCILYMFFYKSATYPFAFQKQQRNLAFFS